MCYRFYVSRCQVQLKRGYAINQLLPLRSSSPAFKICYTPPRTILKYRHQHSMASSHEAKMEYARYTHHTRKELCLHRLTAELQTGPIRSENLQDHPWMHVLRLIRLAKMGAK
jgi:hypothetical protein